MSNMLQALAIKYRPKTFDELIGQESVSISLKYALNSQRLAHAYLFSGLRGSGKTSSARIFSRALVCDEGPNDHPCGKCKQCLAALDGKHIDIIEMDAASNRGLEDIQNLIEQTKYAPSMARFKIFIIDEVHMLTTQAANALLKTLEEPPSYVKFILATTDPLKLPATVLSRTQHFRFKQISQNEIIKHLKFILEKENIPFEDEALKFLARSGGGSLRDTLTLLDQAIIFSQNNIQTQKITQMLGFLDPLKIKEFYTCILKQDKDMVFEFLKQLQNYEASSVIDEMLFYLKDSFFAKNNEFSTLIYERFFRILSKAKQMLSVCEDDGFTLCVMAFMMIEACYLKEIDEEIKQINIQTPKSTQKQENLSPYDKFKKAIYDRDYSLGECFEKNTKFISFDNDIFTISSCAQNNDKIILNNGFKLIKQLIAEVFSPNTQIKIEKEEPLNIDETKLQSIKKDEKLNISSKFEELKKDAQKYDPKEETKQALKTCFGEPSSN